MGTHQSAIRQNADGSIKTRSGRNASQNWTELSAFIDLLRAGGVTSYLEIGARHGDTFFDVMRSLPPGSKGLACDLPGGNWGVGSSRHSLDATCDELKALGYNAQRIYGDSQTPAIASIIRRHGKFDAALIDGDHLYAGVKKDWELYGSRARIVAFHDIAGEGQLQKHSKLPVQVPQLWREIKDQYRHIEFIGEGSKMGIGVLFIE